VIKSLFITGELPGDLREELITHGFQITERSMIKTEAVAFDPQIPHCDWIFFSSKKAVNFFFDRKPVLGQQKLAAIGKGTEQEVKKYGVCDFVGETNDITSVAQQFSNVIGKKTVLFPQSAGSLRSVQNHLDSAQVVDLICYRSLADSIVIPKHSIILFTSPSNTTAYFEKNEITANQKIIAYGKSTSKALNAYGVKDVIIPESLETKTLLDTILRSYHS
jgi:hydroxymethylbilane synthase